MSLRVPIGPSLALRLLSLVLTLSRVCDRTCLHCSPSMGLGLANKVAQLLLSEFLRSSPRTLRRSSLAMFSRLGRQLSLLLWSARLY